MIIRLLTLLVAGCLLVGTALGAEEESTDVQAEGDTTIALIKESRSVVVRIRVRKVQQGESASDAATMLSKDCLQQRAPCTLVDDIRIEIDKNPLFIPRSSFRGLSNVRLAKLTAIRGGFRLLLRGGDGSEGYVSTVIFDKNRVSVRRLASSLAPNDILEETQYRKQKESFDR